MISVSISFHQRTTKINNKTWRENNNLLFPLLLQRKRKWPQRNRESSWPHVNTTDVKTLTTSCLIQNVVLGRDRKHILNHIAHVMRSRVQDSSDEINTNSVESRERRWGRSSTSFWQTNCTRFSNTKESRREHILNSINNNNKKEMCRMTRDDCTWSNNKKHTSNSCYKWWCFNSNNNNN